MHVQIHPSHHARVAGRASALLAVAILLLLLLGGCGGGAEKSSEEGARPAPTRLPGDFPPSRFEAIRPVPFGLFVVSYSDPANERPWVIVYDTEGVPRWWFNPDTRALWGQIVRDGSVVWARSFGDGYGLDPR